jgi:hypothetical protein
MDANNLLINMAKDVATANAGDIVLVNQNGTEVLTL